ncbi:MAG TPA: tetratricopeptide repeat protein [Bacteroidia bacterium]|nr:tetratricopeptide repeat protein [Bacteroidia bacterium]
MIGREENDTSKVNALNRLAFLLRSSDQDTALNYATQAKDISDALRYEKGQADACNVIGIIDYRRGDYIGAIRMHMRALDIRERTGDQKGAALSYINLGNVYSDQNQNAMAQQQYLAAVDILKKEKDHGRLAIVYLDIGTIYLSQNNDSAGLEYNRMAMDEAQLAGKTDVEGQALNNMGVAYEAEGKFGPASVMYRKAYGIACADSDKVAMTDAAINLGNISRKTKNIRGAFDWHFKAEQYARSNGYLEGIRVLYEEISNDYRDTGDFEKALYYHTRFKEVSDSLFNDENTTKIIELTNRWQGAEREKELMESRNEIAQRTEAERKANQRLWIAGTGAVFLLFFAGYVFYAYSRNRRAGLLLAAQKDEIERKSEELEMKNRDITDSIVYSRRIQRAMLPSEQKFRELLPDSFVFYKPRDIVSGDFYWVESWGDEILVAAGDCTGHGVPGALLSVVGLNLLNQTLQVYGITKPAAVLNALNRGMAQALGQKYSSVPSRDDPFEVSDGMDIALVTINRKTAKLEFAGANNPVWLCRGGVITEYRGDRQPVGQYIPEMQKPFTSHEAELRKGDVIYLFSDGFADQFGGDKGKKYRLSKMKALFEKHSHLPMQQQLEMLEKEFSLWKGDLGQVDDVLVIGVKV